MVKNLLTIVCATSPHRLKSENLMILFNYLIIKNSSMKDCKFIVCADGVNPDSDFSFEENKIHYENYLDSLKEDLEDIVLLKSDKHIGLTKNYLQAWDHEQINTPFVLLINHDTVFTDNILDLNLNELLQNFPEFVNILMFPRLTNDGLNHDWWRNVSIKKYKNYKPHKSWEDCKISFGNQDNCCILKKEAFPVLIDNFYKPEITHFLEDSIQAELIKLDIDNLDAWEKFGGCMHPDSNNIHLDGQSKAGSWRQENCRGGENIWSDGKVLIQDGNLFKKFFVINPELKKIYKNFLGLLLQDYQKKCRASFERFLSIASSSFQLKHYLSRDFNLNHDVNPIIGNLPEQGKNFMFHIKVEPFKVDLFWEDIRPDIPEGSQVMLKMFSNIMTPQEKLLQNGGHPQGSLQIDLKKFDIQHKDNLTFHLMQFINRRSTGPKPIETSTTNLSFCHFTNDKIYLFTNFGRDDDTETHLSLKRSNGSNMPFEKKLGLFEVKISDMDDCSSIIGFFYFMDKSGERKTSWTFECCPFSADPQLMSNMELSFGDFMNCIFPEKP